MSARAKLFEALVARDKAEVAVMDAVKTGAPTAELWQKLGWSEHRAKMWEKIVAREDEPYELLAVA